MTKKLNTASIQHDLEGSAFFPRRPSRAAPSPRPVTLHDTTAARGDERGVRADGRTPVRRKLVRHPFEFYEDQVAELRRISLEAQLRGEKTSMSEIVRRALDAYLRNTGDKQ